MPGRRPRLPRRAPGGTLNQLRAASERRLGPRRPGRRSRSVRGTGETPFRGPRRGALESPSGLRRQPRQRLSSRRERCRSKGAEDRSARWSSGAPETRIGLDRAPFRGAFATLHFSTSTRGRSVEPAVDSTGRARGSRGRSAWTSRRSSTVRNHRSKMLWTSVDDREPAPASSTGQSLLPTDIASTEALHDTSVGALDLAFIHNSTCPLLRRRIL